MTAGGAPLLEVEDLRTWFETPRGEARAVDGVSFRLREGETLGLVGESGCGKSVTALSLTGLVPAPGRVLPGSSVRLRGEELVGAPEARLREVRGGEIAMIFQEPMTSLNPVMRVGEQVREAVVAHRGGRKGATAGPGPEGAGRGRGAAGAEGDAGRPSSREEAVRLLGRVGIPDPGERYAAHPHQLSGGQRQRVMVAMALACRPSVLVADEPTTALDVTVQAQILALLRSVQEEHGMALLLISHDLGVVAQMADRVAVMYAGQVAEEAPVGELFRRPRHPYTEGLLAAVPDLEAPRGRLAAIGGSVPHPTRWPDGCRFHPRCPHAWDRCRGEGPPPLPAGRGRARCWLVEEPGRRRSGGAAGRAPGEGGGDPPGSAPADGDAAPGAGGEA